MRRRSTRRPAKASVAGRSVTDAATTTGTARLAESATPYRKETPVKARPRIETTTVPPATITLRPAVVTASTIAVANVGAADERRRGSGSGRATRSRCRRRSRSGRRLPGRNRACRSRSATIPISVAEMPSPKIATSSGKPAATTEPKAIKRTTAAASRPISSGGAPSSAELMRLPPSSIRSPSPEVSSARSMSFVPDSVSSWKDGRSSSSRSRPIVPSAE